MLTAQNILIPLKKNIGTIKVPLSNIWHNLEIPFNSCEVNVILTWPKECVIASNIAADQVTIFTITDTKLDVKLLVILSTEANLAQNPIANTKIFFIIEDASKPILDFLQGTVKVW